MQLRLYAFMLGLGCLMPTRLGIDPIFLAVGPGVDINLDGQWARFFPARDGGWHAFWTTQGEYVHTTLRPDFSQKPGVDPIALTGRNDLRDHAIAPCPDGTWLHIASGFSPKGEAAYAFRYSKDFTLMTSQMISGGSSYSYNDMTVICSPGLWAAGFQPMDQWDHLPVPGQVLFVLNQALDVVDVVELENAPDAGGGALLRETSPDRLVAVGFEGSGGPFKVAEYDLELKLLRKFSPELMAGGGNSRWSQGLVRVGDVYFVAHIAQDNDEQRMQGQGNLWVQAYDLNWRHLDGVQLSNTGGAWGMRPFLAVREEEIIASYDLLFDIYVFRVRLNMPVMNAISGEHELEVAPTEDDLPCDNEEYPYVPSCSTVGTWQASPPAIVLVAGFLVKCSRARQRPPTRPRRQAGPSVL